MINAVIEICKPRSLTRVQSLTLLLPLPQGAFGQSAHLTKRTAHLANCQHICFIFHFRSKNVICLGPKMLCLQLNHNYIL